MRATDEIYSSLLDGDQRGGVVGGKQSLTIDQAAYHLVHGEPGWSSQLQTPATVTYAYRADAPAVMPDGVSGFTRFTTAQILQAEQALTSWSDVANITFVRVGAGASGEGAYSDQATILLGNYTTGRETAAAFAYFPGSTAASSASGDVWINITKGTNAAPAPGNYGALVLVHELGHTIGIDHPGDYDTGGSPTYAADAAYYEDSRQYTVMTYFGEANTGAYYGGRYAAAPQLDDIAAAQLEYGANMSTRTGDTIYGFHSNAGRAWFDIASADARPVFAVWDAGGRDTLDFSGFANSQTIDLREGFFSSVGGLTGNVAIAKGVTIENAVGGSGADAMIGNGADNALLGGAGGDTIRGGEGSNFLRGEAGGDLIYGGGGFDDIHGNMGGDTGYGGAGDDWVVGGQNNDQMFGEAGADIVYGNLGDDVLYGGLGSDTVRGGQDQDLVYGEDGDDWISGDRGDDTIWGGAGADSFHTWGDAGLDRIMDFSRAQGDRVLVSEAASFTLAQIGADVVITIGAGAQMTLVNVDAATLSDGWIVSV
ncbi:MULTISPECIES: M10 family metallopeptidase C-terminal domain-containing protein [Phenylobacterium]|uniref:Serralysin n=1 Tax=Phenylobacterium koreense TaxID=266125 RepID=A0ABV2EES8_9CAUL